MSASELSSALVDAARGARSRAIAPYSRFAVGAALQTAGGGLFTGCNIENATYGLTVCAERVALLKALSEGERAFTALAIVTANEHPTPPCGACRQLLWEFCGDIPIVLASPTAVLGQHQLKDLLPMPFDAKQLK